MSSTNLFHIGRNDILQEFVEIDRKKIKENDCTLFRIVYGVDHSGYYLEVHIRNNNKEGIGLLFSNFDLVVALLQFKNEILNGMYSLYTDMGDLQFKANFKNGICDGICIEYNENGKIAFYKIYKEGVLFSYLSHCGSFWEEKESENNTLISISSFNANWERDGVCFTYLNGQFHKKSLFCHDIEIRVLNEVINGKLNVYNKKNEIVYCGEFLDSFEKEYPPHGKGIAKRNNKTIYMGEWCEGKRHGIGRYYENGRLLYRGSWEQGLPNGLGSLLYSSGEVQFDGT